MRTPHTFLPITALVAFALAACDTYEMPPPEKPTEIARVEQTPSPARVGDLVRLRAVVSDSSDRTLRYSWVIADRDIIGSVSDIMHVRIPANSARWEGILSVSREGEVPSTERGFKLIVAREW